MQQIIALVGFSSAGKDTMANYLRDEHGYHFASLHTSRPIREGESEGKPHYFTTKEKIFEMEKEGALISLQGYLTTFEGVPETAYYGLHESSFHEDESYVLPIGFNTIDELRERFGSRLTVIFLNVSEKTRKERAKARGSFDEKEWNNRATRDSTLYPLKFVKSQVDIIMSNNDIAHTKEQINKLIRSET